METHFSKINYLLLLVGGEEGRREAEGEGEREHILEYMCTLAMGVHVEVRELCEVGSLHPPFCRYPKWSSGCLILSEKSPL